LTDAFTALDARDVVGLFANAIRRQQYRHRAADDPAGGIANEDLGGRFSDAHRPV